jgi:hypothetical protein
MPMMWELFNEPFDNRSDGMLHAPDRPDLGFTLRTNALELFRYVDGLGVSSSVVPIQLKQRPSLVIASEAKQSLLKNSSSQRDCSIAICSSQ